MAAGSGVHVLHDMGHNTRLESPTVESITAWFVEEGEAGCANVGECDYAAVRMLTAGHGGACMHVWLDWTACRHGHRQTQEST